MVAWALIVAGALAVAGTGCADDGGPRLAGVTPAAAGRNATVTLTGQRLCGASGDCAHAAGEIQLGLVPPVVLAGVTSYDDTRATIVIPLDTPVGPSALVVTVNEQSSNALDFEVLP
jgi:hypothetical protein